ncbi:MAG: YraN family protein [Muribaculaceae bacterium]|nr:YraN family protein [Muribaculaceae bacterium]MBQ7211081.1 YraN family protein [Muribaculaceae bacterium]
MATHNVTGQWGEQLACDLLVTKGYAIVERNWRSGHYEIDIVAMKGQYIVFVEVKTREDDIVDPLDSIDAKKIQRICRAADVYIRANNIPHEAQFDIITIIGDTDNYRIEHIPDAFLPPLKTYR